MSSIVVLTFDDPNSAGSALRSLRELEGRGEIDIDDTAVVVRDAGGDIHVKNELGDTMTLGILTGGFLGMMLLFMFPVIGAVLGALGGILVVKSLDKEVDQTFVKEVTQALQPNTSALFLLVNSANLDATVAALQPYRGRVYHTTLSPEAQDGLRRALAEKK
jgi:uncharacterized membrane protein